MTDTTTGHGVPAPRVLGGRYEVGNLLGRGGMAEVHVAHDTRLGRTVAVKLLRSDLARDPSFQARFRREAQAAAGLNHPSIVAVYDTGAEHLTEHGGGRVELPWIVMEYVEGRTLRDMLRTDHPLAITDALAYTEGVLAALEYSHRMGIVHRDIKPANVMITPAGEVKVMDFGIARAVSDSSATLTQTSAVMGTAQYLSPEQARGEQVDARSDLYSTGCLLYEILTGRPPFTGDAPVAVAYQHVSEQPRPPSALVPDIPPAVDSVVLMALSKDREHRYQSAGDFADDLRRAVEGRPLRGASLPPTAQATQQFAAAAPTTVTPPVPAGPATGTLPRVPDDGPVEQGRPRRWPWVLVIVALLLGIGVAVWALSNTGGGTGAPTETTASTPATVQVPAVVNSSQDEAQQEIEGAGLTANFTQAADDDVEAGNVVSTDPEAGTEVQVGGTVNVVVSSGPEAVQVPNVRGQSQEDARRQLQQAGFEVANVNPVDDASVDQGEVVSTDPAIGSSQPRGTSISLDIASGQVTVPNVVGRSQADALTTLNGLGFSTNTREEQSPEDEPGSVVEQSLPANTRVDAGSSIDLVIAAQPTATSTPTSSPSESPSASPTGSPTGSALGTGAVAGSVVGSAVGSPSTRASGKGTAVEAAGPGTGKDPDDPGRGSKGGSKDGSGDGR
ncbi:Stk1 family PASTA domain-containing Ser/Thr kinase [Kineococcus sp. TBRC 1896]|uniref:non-specific serine/threonine protein kinase n=2 Tax=Kineococcus mangrovi TaxID=1660183 RepID=A0ABV4I419_9ACTN